MVEFVNLSKYTGAEIKGVDLSKPLSKELAKEIYDVFLDRTVIVFRGQSLTQEQLVAATQNFGEAGEYDRPKEFHGEGQKRSHERVMLITNIREDGKPIGSLPDGEMWFHHDTIHRQIPHKGTLLYSVEIPSEGGETLFSNLFAAYDELPDDLKSALEGKKAHNAYNYGSAKKGDPNAVPARNEAIHPAIRTHEENNRKAIFVDRLMTQSLVDVPQAESDAILERVFDFIEQDRFVYEHVWRKGDVVMWDNRSSIHARKDFPDDQVRLMWRTTIAGNVRPY